MDLMRSRFWTGSSSAGTMLPLGDLGDRGDRWVLGMALVLARATTFKAAEVPTAEVIFGGRPLRLAGVAGAGAVELAVVSDSVLTAECSSPRRLAIRLSFGRPRFRGGSGASEALGVSSVVARVP